MECEINFSEQDKWRYEEKMGEEIQWGGKEIEGKKTGGKDLYFHPLVWTRVVNEGK